MGSPCCKASGRTWEGHAAAPGEWCWEDLDMSQEPSLQVHSGPLFVNGREELDGRRPEEELDYLLEHEDEEYEKYVQNQDGDQIKELRAAKDTHPAACSPLEAAEFLQRLDDGSCAFLERRNAAVPAGLNKGLRGPSPLHVASMPSSKPAAHADALLFCLEEGVGFGVIRQQDWARLSFRVWTMRQREAIGDERQLLVLTNEDGSLDFGQSVEVAWLRRERAPFRHMRVSSFLLQARPLLQAVVQKRQEMVLRLLQPASRDQAHRLLRHRDHLGDAALHHLARQQGKKDLIRVLVSAKADVDARNFAGCAPLHVASALGHEAAAEQLIAGYAKLNLAAANGSTALCAAAEGGHEALLKVLMDAMADVDRARNAGATPLFMACTSGRAEAVQLLLDACAGPDEPLAVGIRPLVAACRYGHASVVRALLQARADLHGGRDKRALERLDAAPDAMDAALQELSDSGLWEGPVADDTALLETCKWGHEAVARVLFEAFAVVEHADARGLTPLLVATTRGHGAMVKQLLDAAADPERAGPACLPPSQHLQPCDRQLATPLWWAGHLGHKVIAQHILAGHADPGTRGKGGSTALHAASQEGHVAVAQQLLLARADVDPVLDSGALALDVASQHGRGDVVALLLAARAGLGQHSDKFHRALDLASEHGHEAAVQLLLEAHADPKRGSDTGNTPLHRASRHGYSKVMHLLLQAHADPNQELIKTNEHSFHLDDGPTPLISASRHGHEEAVLELLRARAHVEGHGHKKDGLTPVMEAKRRGKSEAVVRLLLVARAELHQGVI